MRAFSVTFRRVACDSEGTGGTCRGLEDLTLTVQAGSLDEAARQARELAAERESTGVRHFPHVIRDVSLDNLPATVQEMNGLALGIPNEGDQIYSHAYHVGR